MRTRIGLCIVLLAGIVAVVVGANEQRPPAAAPADNEELKRIYDQDQADRSPVSGRDIDWGVVGPRDEQREIRVKALLGQGGVRTGTDYYHAAMVLQHAVEPDDYLLCHDLCVVAIGKGEKRAKWLAAASLDRFLVSIGRPQRFGTQYGGSRAGTPMRLREVDPSVTDELRREFDVPPITEARMKEAKMKAEFEARKSATRR